MIWFIVLCAPLILWLIKFVKYERFLCKFPGPNPWPIIGNALEFNTPTKIMSTLIKYRKQYRENFRIYMGFDPITVVTEPKSVEFFLSNTTANARQHKSKHYTFFRKWLGNGLLVSNGEYWKNRRRILTPAFHFNILKDYVKTFNSVGDVLVEKLEPFSGEEINIFPFSKLAALDVLCEATMGSSVGALENSDSNYVKSVEKMARVIIDRIFSALQSIDFLFQFTENAKIEMESLKVIHSYSKSVIKKRKDEISGTDVQNQLPMKKRQAFLDLLITYSLQGANLSNEDIQEEVDTFMFAGHDTTASAISFMLYAIGRNERVQEKIFEEITTIYGSNPNKAITYEDLQEMKYIDMVIKESLRIYPSVPFFFREIMEDLVFDGKVYPKGSTIMVFNYGMHHDPNYFKNPEEFYPERFETESNEYRTGGTFSYVPFSAGPRNCIGQRFAVLQMKTIIYKVLKKYKLSPCWEHEVALGNETVLVSKNGIPIRISLRE